MLSRAFISKGAAATIMVGRASSRIAPRLAVRQAAARLAPTHRLSAVRSQHTSKPVNAAAAQRLAPLDTFPRRHIGPDADETQAMLKQIGVKDIDELLSKAIPSTIRSPKPLTLGEGLSERELLKRLKAIASKNKVYRSYLGMGYTDTVVPNVILRNVMENPAWYTQVC